MKKCVFAGTFDPFTVGHADTVETCLALFDEVIVAIAENRQKTCAFSAQERAEMVAAVYRDERRVRVMRWGGTVAALLGQEGTPFYVRGVRNAADFEYETADYYASCDLDPSIVALYVPARQRHLHVSSTLVKNCIAFGTPYEAYVPRAIYDYIRKKEGSHHV